MTVIDKMEKAGGMLTYAIPNYRLPQTYVEQVVAAYEKMGIKFRLNCNVGEDVTTGQLEKDYDDVFYATGAWKRPVLGFDGEEFTEFGLEFLVEVDPTDTWARHTLGRVHERKSAYEAALPHLRLAAVMSGDPAHERAVQRVVHLREKLASRVN